MISPDQLQAWKRLADEASPGKWHDNKVHSVESWHAVEDDHGEEIVSSRTWTNRNGPSALWHGKNAAFIAAARTAVPQLIFWVEQLAKDLEEAATERNEAQLSAIRLRKQLECAIKQRNEFALQGKFTVDVLDAEIEAIK